MVHAFETEAVFHTVNFWKPRTKVCDRFSKFSRVQPSNSGRQERGGGPRDGRCARKGGAAAGKEEKSHCPIVREMAGTQLS